MVRRSLKTQPQAIYVYIRTIDTLITLVIDRACNERAEACAHRKGLGTVCPSPLRILYAAQSRARA